MYSFHYCLLCENGCYDFLEVTLLENKTLKKIFTLL